MTDHAKYAMTDTFTEREENWEWIQSKTQVTIQSRNAERIAELERELSDAKMTIKRLRLGLGSAYIGLMNHQYEKFVKSALEDIKTALAELPSDGGQ